MRPKVPKSRLRATKSRQGAAKKPPGGPQSPPKTSPGAPQTRFWHAPGASRAGLGGSRALLFEVFSCLRTYTVQKLRIRKNCSFSLVFPMFFAHCMRGAFTKNSEKSIQEPFERHCSRQPHQHLVLGVPGLDFGGLWGPPGRFLAGSWAALGRSWPALGHSWAHLGRFLGVSWSLPGAYWCPRRARARFSRVPGGVRGDFGRSLGPIFRVFFFHAR